MDYDKQVTALKKYCLKYFFHSKVDNDSLHTGYVFIHGFKDEDEFRVNIPLLSIFKKMDYKGSYHEFIQEKIDTYINDVGSIYDEFYKE